MLQAFRKHAYSWVTRTLLGFLIAVFIVFFGGLGSYFLQIKPVATVDCHTILHLFTLPGCHNILPDEIDREADRIHKAVQNTRGADAAQMLQGVNLREMAVESLIEQTLIDREAHRLGLAVSDNDLAKAIESQTVFQSDGAFDPRRYDQVLRDNGLDPAAFESSTRGKILSDTLRQMITNAVQVSSDEARADFNRFGEKIALTYVAFPYANFATTHPTDKEIAKFYADDKEAFREPDRVSFEFIRYDPTALAPAEPPSADAIGQYFEQHVKADFTHPAQIHVRHILIPVAPDASAPAKAAAKAQIDDLMRKVKAGASFTDLAKEYSGDPSVKQNGGDLGFVTQGELVKPFEDVAFSLKPNELGEAETQYGYHLIQVLEVKGAEVETIEEARPKIIAALKQQEGATIAQQDLKQDLAAADVGRPLNEIAKRRGLVAVNTGYVGQDDPVKGAEDNPKLMKEVFALQTGDIKPISDGPAPYLVKLIDRKPSHIPALNEIKDRVAQTMIRLKAEGEARIAANAFLAQVKSPEAFAAVVKNNRLQTKSTGEFVRASSNVPGIGAFPEVTQAAAATPRVPGVISQVMENGGNSYVFEVVSRTVPTDAEWTTLGPQFTARFLEQKRQAAWVNFIDGLKLKALIVVHSDLIGASSANS